MRHTTGIEIRHARGCAGRGDGATACSCKPAYQANVWSARDRKRIRKTFPTLAAARAWRQDAQVGLRRGVMRAPTSTTLRQAAEAWLKGARTGTIRTRSGQPYKPGTIRSYDESLRNRVLGLYSDARRSRRSTRALARRAATAWKNADPKLEPIGLHECRHTFASLMIAAGVNAKALSTYMGHASLPITYDRYGHLMPGNENEAADLLDAYLERADTAARIAAVEGRS